LTLATTMTAPALGRAAPRKSASAFDDLVAAIERDAGGHANLTEAQHQLARRAATLSIQCRLMEKNQDKMDAGKYATLSNSLRRLLQDLGVERRRVEGG
jgi:hypothetical protein